MKRSASILIILACLVLSAAGQEDDSATASAKPAPEISDGKYGPLERNVFDLWRPRSQKPTPLVVYVHGGGFVSGDKSKLSANVLKRLLENGIAVMAINYSLMPAHLYPQAYLDAARAIQYARHNAKEWNLDTTRVAATGSSAGGLTALWIGFRNDMADQKAADPVLRESTRLRSVAVFSAQTTLVPEVVGPRVGRVTLKHSFYTGRFFGLKTEEMVTEKGRKLTREASPLEYLTPGDPPVWAYYSVTRKPQSDETTVSEAIHHPNFGVVLKEEMDKLRIECILRHKDDGRTVNDDLVAFFIKHFKGK